MCISNICHEMIATHTHAYLPRPPCTGAEGCHGRATCFSLSHSTFKPWAS